MSSIFLPKAPKGYSYFIQRDWDSQYHAVWLKYEGSFNYKKETVKTIWGFIRKKDQKIYSPINSKKPGKPAEYVTAYSAMPPPKGAKCIKITKTKSVSVKKVTQPSSNSLLNFL
jgi:hypothetical protein